MKKFFSLMLVVAMVASLAACGSSSSNESKDTQAAAETTGAESTDGATLKIGGIGPLTGGTAIYGVAVQRGAQIAVDEINAAGGINGAQIEFNYQDDEGDAEKAVNAYNTLKDWGMQVLVGTVTSTPCIAVAAKTEEDNIFQITPSGSAPECITPDNAFRVCFADPDQGTKSAKYIGENGLATKVAVIYDSSDTYSTGIYEAFATEAANQGIEIVATGTFTADNKTDFSVQLQQAQTAGAELVFLPIYYTEASLILTQANKMGFETQFLGGDGLDGVLDVENFDTSLAEGVMLLTPFTATSEDELTTNFVSKYQEAYGEIPNQFAADAYDAIYAIKAAAEQSGVTADMSASDICESLKTGITSITLEGLTGTITWDASGAPEKEPIGVIIEDGSYKIMD
jgi:branched-chain amino acid transport system substrate-binding protein